MAPAFLIAAKDLRLLVRDARSAVILVLMPLVLIAILGVSLGDAFGRKECRHPSSHQQACHLGRMRADVGHHGLVGVGQMGLQCAGHQLGLGQTR